MTTAKARAEILQCANCARPFLGDGDNPPPCPTCGSENVARIPYTSGYDRPHMLSIWARADMLEILAGKDDAERELVFALGAADSDDSDTLRWLAVCIETRLAELEVPR